MKQIVAHKKLSTLHGLALVLGILAVLLIMNNLVLGVLTRAVGFTAANISFWLIGALMALWVLRVYVVKYVYELGADMLRLNRAYGRRVRHIEDIYLNQLLFVGDPEEAKKRWPDSKRVRALHARGEEAVTAVVYKTASGVRTALIQANPALKAKLVERLRAK